MSLVLTRENLANQIADDLATRNANAGLIEDAVNAKAESAEVDDHEGRIDTLESDLGDAEIAIADLETEKENLSNKLTAFQATPDDVHYITEKLAKDSLDALAADASANKQITIDGVLYQYGLTVVGAHLSFNLTEVL